MNTTKVERTDAVAGPVERPVRRDGAEAVLTMTATQLQLRLESARAAAREGAWRELLERFDPRQRRHLANLMAHDWTISAVEIQTCLTAGSKPDERIEATTTTEELWPDGIFKPKRKSA
jgi:hypothetical protein